MEEAELHLRILQIETTQQLLGIGKNKYNLKEKKKSLKENEVNKNT